MPRFKEPYTLIKRKTKSGKFVYYYRTYDDNGKRTTAKSTGETTKGKAGKYCQELIAKGELIPDKDLLFSAYAISRHWWEWGLCRYTLGKLARSALDKPAITQSCVNTSPTFTKNM